MRSVGKCAKLREYIRSLHDEGRLPADAVVYTPKGPRDAREWAGIITDNLTDTGGECGGVTTPDVAMRQQDAL